MSATASWNILDQPVTPDERHHVVQFYETQIFLYEAVSRFIGRGLKEGDGIIVIATQLHREGFINRLKAQGFDTQAAQASGQLTMLDAAMTLSGFMQDGIPDRAKFRALIGDLIQQVASRYPRVRAYGEMVNLLWENDNLLGTVKLEELWNELAKTHPFTLLCGYHMGNFHEESHDKAFHQFCNAHSHVIPAKDFDFAEPGDSESQGRMIVALQRQARALQTEIAQRKSIERALQDALQQLMVERMRFEAVLRQMPAGVVIIDASSGQPILVNDQVSQIFREPFTLESIKTFHPDGHSYKPEDYPFIRALNGATITAEEMDYVRADGTRGTLSASSAPIRDPNGRILAAVATFYDITERKQAQTEWVKASKLESVGLLAAGIAHDFNNILTAILGNVSLAKLFNASNPMAADALNQAEQASVRARDLTQQLLTFSKGGAPIKKPGSIAELLREASTFALSGSNARPVLDIADDLWPATFDPAQLSQVMNNLLINALQAMPTGGTVSVLARNRYLNAANAYRLNPGRYVEIKVCDEGIGIAPEHIGRVFDPYFTTKQTGSGLGLAVSYSVIKRHDGYIGVTSSPDTGTTFIIFLPAADHAPLPARHATDAHTRHGDILLMDDEAAVRKVGAALLQQLGYRVTLAVDGADAIACYTEAMQRGQPFDLVILDVTVPGAMGGKECMERLHELDPHIRAIVSSGYSTDPVMADHVRHKFAGVIAKPYKLDELSDTVCRVLQEGRAAAVE